MVDAVTSDHELLELAAKAIGLQKTINCLGKPAWTTEQGSGCFAWNPLTDDGDALRALAVMPSLRSLKLMFGTPSIVMDVAWGTGKGIVTAQRASEYDDRAAAIRRAIVTALAEIGKELP